MKPILLDVMLGDRFYCQLKYTSPGFPIILDDGNFAEAVDFKDLEKFVEEKRPSLIGKDYHIEIASQRVLT